MRKIIMAGLVILAVMVQLVTAASAMLIVDTGSPTPESFIGYTFLGGILRPPDPTQVQWLAAEFTISQEYIVTSAKGYMKGGWLGDTLVTVAIMNNSGGLPGITIFSQSFTTTQPEAWQGLTGLNWDLPTGTYWAAFEAWTPFAQMTMNAPKPLPMYAYTVFYPDIENPTWRQLSNNSICIQVEANPVPLPGTIILLGSGLLGLGGWRGFGKS